MQSTGPGSEVIQQEGKIHLPHSQKILLEAEGAGTYTERCYWPDAIETRLYMALFP